MFFLDGIKYKIKIKSVFQNLGSEIASLIEPKWVFEKLQAVPPLYAY